jgi:hypothetical protein
VFVRSLPDPALPTITPIRFIGKSNEVAPCRSKGPETMRSTNHSRSRRVLAFVSLILPFGLALSSQHEARAQSAPPVQSCAAALDALTSEWRSIGFVEPSKPAQIIVAARHGYMMNGGQFSYMRHQMRVAARDCAAGNNADALAHINSVRRILDRTADRDDRSTRM